MLPDDNWICSLICIISVGQSEDSQTNSLSPGALSRLYIFLSSNGVLEECTCISCTKIFELRAEKEREIVDDPRRVCEKKPL